MTEHDCRKWSLDVAYSVSGTSIPVASGTVCQLCGTVLAGSIPPQVKSDDPFEPYASEAWTEGDGMDDVRRVADVWERSSDERETRP